MCEGEDSPFAAMCSPVRRVTALLAARIRRYPLDIIFLYNKWEVCYA